MKYAQVILTVGSDGDADHLANYIAGYLSTLLPEDFGWEEDGRVDGYDGPFLRTLNVDVKEGMFT